MKFQRFEFDKSRETIENFSNQLQEAINNSGDIASFRAYENGFNSNIVVELSTTKNKTTQFELIAFGLDRPVDVVNQINDVLTLALNQSKDMVTATVIPYSKSHRAVGFLVLSLVSNGKTNAINDQDSSDSITQEKEAEDQTREQNKKASSKPNKRTKRS